ncbi:TPA: hypothetical protein N0F65_009654 [Lagenidium giganteum]|uniref:Uncharacterized protein n=1 Tax=Lagenidium giganteum TaxID=4803 RepID=A0AAV2YKA9_9STRA|nr:TPA: hypothetical protein N0F65_009654 [Lagenidium giganteum]
MPIFDPDSANAEHSLYDTFVNPLVLLTPLPIAARRTEIHLDGHSTTDGTAGIFSENVVGGFVLSIEMGNALIKDQQLFVRYTLTPSTKH